ncbi:MAG: sugar transferase [Oscillospiraceae bacterium]|nr:sugar transferase [Oscillospiraceae bacterium]
MYKNNNSGILKHLDFIFLDLVCVFASFFLAEFIGGYFDFRFNKSAYINISVVTILIDFVVLIFFERLKDVIKRGIYKEVAATVKHVCTVELILIFYIFIFYNNEHHSNIVLCFMGGIYFILSLFTRMCWKRVIRYKKPASKRRSLIIVTTNDMANKVVKSIQNNTYAEFRLAGIAIIDKDMMGKSIRGLEVIANLENVANYVCREWVDEIFIDLPQDYTFPHSLVNSFVEMGVVVHINIDSTVYKMGQQQIVERLGSYTVLTTSINFTTPTQLFIKRFIDIIGGLLGCFVTGLLYLVLAPIIYIKSPGPIFFKQVRVGKNGKKFKMYKFRSMYLDAEEKKKELMKENIMSDGMMFKAEWDDRIIGSKRLPNGTTKKGIGNIIRDWSLDEFPQFINVLKGDMSLVGTRPPTLDEWEKYELHHRARLATKPGLTGMWQVSGRSKITDFEEVVKLDTQYINQWNIGLDLKILLKTVAVVLKKEGSM